MAKPSEPAINAKKPICGANPAESGGRHLLG